MVEHFRELRVYQHAVETAMRIFRLSARWLCEERYSLTDQVRRSSRSVATNIAEAWCKRRYVSHFVSKLSDADAEAAETQAWLDFALRCRYISDDEFSKLDQEYEAISGGLVRMMAQADQWCGPSSLVKEEEPTYETAP